MLLRETYLLTGVYPVCSFILNVGLVLSGVCHNKILPRSSLHFMLYWSTVRTLISWQCCNGAVEVRLNSPAPPFNPPLHCAGSKGTSSLGTGRIVPLHPSPIPEPLILFWEQIWTTLEESGGEAIRPLSAFDKDSTCDLAAAVWFHYTGAGRGEGGRRNMMISSRRHLKLAPEGVGNSGEEKNTLGALWCYNLERLSDIKWTQWSSCFLPQTQATSRLMLFSFKTHYSASFFTYYQLNLGILGTILWKGIRPCFILKMLVLQCTMHGQ